MKNLNVTVMNWFGFSRKTWKSIGQFLGLSLCCGFLIVSCGGQNTAPTENAASPSPEAGGSGDRLIVGLVEKPRTLDPADGYELVISDVHYSLGDRLYTYVGDTDKLEPQLATDFPQISEDGLTYKIPLREGVVFHDGTPFNAEAMVFSLNRFAQNGGKPSFLLTDIMESVEATGDYEITIKLKNRFSAFPAVLAYSGICAVSPKAYELGEGKFKPNEFVGTGPYRLVEFSPTQIRLDAFEDYWGEKPTNAGLDFQYLSNSANLYNSFTTGALDIAFRDIDPDQVTNLQKQASAKGFQVLEQASPRVDYLVLNTQSPPLTRLR